MEVKTAIPQLVWNGHGNHTPGTRHHADNDIGHSSSECHGLTTSDSPPPLPTTSPPDYCNHTETGNYSSDSPSGLQSHSSSDKSPQSNVHHSITASEATRQAKALSDGEMYSNSDDNDDLNDDEELGVLEQLKSCSTSKLMQLQQVQLREDNDKVSSSQTVEIQDYGQAEVLRLRKEVAGLKEQNKQLLALRSQMDGEIENLTSSLFEEAYKMVNEAKAGKIQSDKKLADANGKIDALEAEIVALKVLLEHNGADAKALPPSAAVGKKVMGRKIGSLKHHRSHSADRFITPPDHQPSSSTPSSQNFELLHITEVEEQELQDFHSWLEGMSTDPSDPFIQHILDVDVIPCLSFTNKQLSDLLVTAVQQNSLQMELISNTTDCPNECALTGAKSKPCQYRMRLKDTDNWHYISLSARNKIATVCNFFMFLRHIQQGLIKSTTKTIYIELCKLRASMHMTRLGVEVKNSSKQN